MQSFERLNAPQQTILDLPFDQGQKVFVIGPAGSGKSTALQRRLISLLAAGVPSYTILILLPELEAGEAYRAALAEAGLGPYSDLHLSTFTSLARELVNLFWPMIARQAGFQAAHAPPTFIGYDLAQVHMKQIVEPMLAEGSFEGLRLRPQQILSQLLDNLNRAALNGLGLDQMEDRLVHTWSGDPQHVRYFRQAAEAARRFRHSCLQSNLLDLSLVVELFWRHLLANSGFHGYLTERYQHLLVDNLEEMPPVGVEFLRTLLPGRQSTVLAFDQEGGYKRYLAADPHRGQTLSKLCDWVIAMPTSLTTSKHLTALANLIQRRLTGPADLTYSGAEKAVLHVIEPRYRREMIRETVSYLVESLIPQVSHPSQIAIVTPYLDRALLFGLTSELAEANLSSRLLRRRASPRDEPLVRAWLTLAALAHPHWGIIPSQYDIVEGLALAVGGLDRPRAALAAQALYHPAEHRFRPVSTLSQVDIIRIGPPVVKRLGELQGWLDQWPGTEPLDRFFSQLFANLLSNPRFQPEPGAPQALHQAAVCDWLIKAANRFRRAAPALDLPGVADQGRVFIESIYDGIVTGMPPISSGIETPDRNSVIIATLYAYLLTGPAVQFQIWLEAGAIGWWEIPRQPLSNAFVLNPDWQRDQLWTEADGFALRNQLMVRIVRGLCARCSQGIVVASSNLDRRGERQEGPLWRALSPLFT